MSTFGKTLTNAPLMASCSLILKVIKEIDLPKFVHMHSHQYHCWIEGSVSLTHCLRIFIAYMTNWRTGAAVFKFAISLWRIVKQARVAINKRIQRSPVPCTTRKKQHTISCLKPVESLFQPNSEYIYRKLIKHLLFLHSLSRVPHPVR